MFIADDRCLQPLHILIADIVDSQEGSALLHKTLNRLGVCVSQEKQLKNNKTEGGIL